MLTLNLVSKELKQEIKSKHIYSLLKRVNYILIIISIIIAIILLTAKIILQNNFNNVVAQTTLLTSNTRGYTDKVKNINKQLNSINKIQKEYMQWSRLLEIISNINPDGVAFSYLKINKNDSSIKIRGFANTRDDLLILKKGFEDSEIFMDVAFPLSNILQKEKINFEIDMKFDINKLNLVIN